MYETHIWVHPESIADTWETKAQPKIANIKKCSFELDVMASASYSV